MNSESLVKINDTHKLPSWFNINSYLPSADFDAKKWYEQLLIRQYCYKVGLKSEAANQILAEIWSNPIVTIKGNPTLERIMRYGSTGKFKSHIHSTTARELELFALEKIPCDTIPALDRLVQDNLYERHGADNQACDTVSCGSEALMSNIQLVTINGNYTKTELMSQFERFLDVSLDEKSKQKRFYKKDFSKWYEYGILPYLDLFMWAEATNHHITQETYCNAIYVNTLRDVDTLRHTTITLANSLLTDAELDKLAAQVNLQSGK